MRYLTIILLLFVTCATAQTQYHAPYYPDLNIIRFTATNSYINDTACVTPHVEKTILAIQHPTRNSYHGNIDSLVSAGWEPIEYKVMADVIDMSLNDMKEKTYYNVNFRTVGYDTIPSVSRTLLRADTTVPWPEDTIIYSTYYNMNLTFHLTWEYGDTMYPGHVWNIIWQAQYDSYVVPYTYTAKEANYFLCVFPKGKIIKANNKLICNETKIQQFKNCYIIREGCGFVNRE